MLILKFVSPKSPILLTKQKESRGITTTDVFDFEYTPTSSISNESGFLLQSDKNKWFSDYFGKDGVYQETTSLAISEVLNIESKFSVDIDNDGNFGDKVDVFLANDNTNSGIYKTLTGAFVSDNKGLNSGDYLFDPTLLIKQMNQRESKQQVFIHLNTRLLALFLTIIVVVQYIIKIIKIIGLKTNSLKMEYL